MAKLVKSVLVALFATGAFAQNAPEPAKTPDSATPAAARRPARRPASAFLVTGQPYSAEQTSDHFQALIDGTHLTRHLSTTKLFRDSQDRVRIEKTMEPSLRGLDTTDIYDPAAGVEYILNVPRRTARKIPFGGTFSLITPIVGCPTDFSDYIVPDLHQQATCEALGTKMIQGIAAVGSRVTTVTPVGAVGNDKPIATVMERWTSPELKVVLLQTDSDPRTGQGTEKLTIISRDEPDASLFRPADD